MFKDLYSFSKDMITNKSSTFKDWNKGSVIITDSPIILSDNTYYGRTKIYNKNNVWTDTSPIILNSIKCLNDLLKTPITLDSYSPISLKMNDKVKSLVVHKGHPLEDYININEKTKDLRFIPIIKDS